MAPGRTDFLCELEVREAGEFEGQLHLFVDDGGTREIILKVKGTTKLAEEKPGKK